MTRPFRALPVPCKLLEEEVAAFLDVGNRWAFLPYGGALTVLPCASPLKGPPVGQHGGADQLEFF